MTTSQYVLNLGLLAWILMSNLGTRPIHRGRLVLPLLIVVAICGTYLRSIPTHGNDLWLDAAGVAVGAALGVVTALLVSVRRVGLQVVTRAGAGFTALWVAVIGGRMLFAYGADHWFTGWIVGFSRDHLITGGEAWTAAFVMMAMAMVAVRVIVTGVVAERNGGLVDRSVARARAMVEVERTAAAAGSSDRLPH